MVRQQVPVSLVWTPGGLVVFPPRVGSLCGCLVGRWFSQACQLFSWTDWAADRCCWRPPGAWPWPPLGSASPSCCSNSLGWPAWHQGQGPWRPAWQQGQGPLGCWLASAVSALLLPLPSALGPFPGSSWPRYSTTPYSTVQYSTLQCNVVQWNGLQRSDVQGSVVQLSSALQRHRRTHVCCLLQAACRFFLHPSRAWPAASWCSPTGSFASPSRRPSPSCSPGAPLVRACLSMDLLSAPRLQAFPDLHCTEPASSFLQLTSLPSCASWRCCDLWAEVCKSGHVFPGCVSGLFSGLGQVCSGCTAQYASLEYSSSSSPFQRRTVLWRRYQLSSSSRGSQPSAGLSNESSHLPCVQYIGTQYSTVLYSTASCPLGCPACRRGSRSMSSRSIQ